MRLNQLTLLKEKLHIKITLRTSYTPRTVEILSVCIPAMVLPSDQPKSSLTAITLCSQMIRIPPGHLQNYYHVIFACFFILLL